MRATTRTKATVPLLAALALAAGATGARAQALVLAPRAGVYVAGSDLGEVRRGLETVRAELEGSFAVGFSAELRPPASALGFRLGFDYATDSRVSPDGIREDPEGGARLLGVAGDLVLRPPRLILVQPYVLAGAGVKRYDFERDALEGGVRDAFPDEKTDFTLHGGAGLDLKPGPLALVAELTDYASWFRFQNGEDRKLQNDVFATLGLRLGL